MTQSSSRPFLLALLPALLLGGCKKPAADNADEKPVAIVQAVHPSTGYITDEISADAVLSPAAESAIVPKVLSPIRKFYVQRGSRVRAGQLVATLENSDLQGAALDTSGAYDAAKGTYSAATQSTVPEEQTRSRLDLEQAEATLVLDNSILKARSALLAQGAIPGRDVDTARAAALQAQAAFDIAQQRLQVLQKTGTSASLQSARGQLESAKGKYLQAQAQLSYTEVRAPISGIVTDRPLFPGETPAAGAALLTIMDTSSMIAKLHIPQAEAQQLKLGAASTIEVPGLDHPLPAQVSLISPALDPGSTTVEVWLKVANPTATLKAGTAVHASLKGRTIQGAVLIPTDAIQRSPEGAGKIVLVIAPDGTARKRVVTTGIQTKDSTEILDGLKLSDIVITGGGYGLDEGTKVKIGPAETKDPDDSNKPDEAKDAKESDKP